MRIATLTSLVFYYDKIATKNGPLQKALYLMELPRVLHEPSGGTEDGEKVMKEKK